MLVGHVAGGAWGAVAGVVVAAAVVARFRRWFAARDDARQHREAWRDACRYAGLHVEAVYRDGRLIRDGRPGPRLESVEATPTGRAYRVRMCSGWTPSDLERAREALTAYFCARRVDVVRDPASHGTVTVHVVRTDPFDGGPIPWPEPLEVTSLWTPVRIGVDEHGHDVTVTLPGINGVLLGGVSGSGKSSLIQLLTARAALDPRARLSVFDGKGGMELGMWAGVADRFIEDDARRRSGTRRDHRGHAPAPGCRQGDGPPEGRAG